VSPKRSEDHPVPDSRTHSVGEPTVQEIIASARTAPASAGGVWLLSGLTAVLLWASFTPLDWGPLGWICLVPLILLVRLKKPTRWMYRAIYACGLLNTLVTLQWMRLGDRSMYPAWIALAIYTAVYFPLFVGLARVAVHRFSAPLIFAVPAAWVGLEYLRAHLLTGFSWYYLGHTQYRWIELIQICDLVGAYGVSFVVSMMSACVAGLVPVSVFAKLRLLPVGNGSQVVAEEHLAIRQWGAVGVCLLIFAAVLGYGYIRRAQADFREGPRVALVQGNYTASLKHDPSEWGDIFRRHDYLTGQAVQHQPDVIVWPESMFRWPLMESPPPDMTDDQLQQVAPQIPLAAWKDPTVRRTLADMSQKAGAAMIIGIDTFQADCNGLRHYNSAAFIRPDVGLFGRYDKLHRVLFGEYIPLKEELPWLHKLTPFPADFGIAAGRSASVFHYKNWRFAPIICFEDTVPHLVRNIVKSVNDEVGKRKAELSDLRIPHSALRTPHSVDCLVNLTNDGWFHGSSELDQHLITAAFRAVECRTPMVRAVNTGISAVIDGDGIIREPDVFFDGDGEGRQSMRDPRTGRWHKQLNAVLVDTIPLDNRASLYVAWGDWFAASCCVCCLIFALVGFVPRRRNPKDRTAHHE